jgi:hypothetical protein
MAVRFGTAVGNCFSLKNRDDGSHGGNRADKCALGLLGAVTVGKIVSLLAMILRSK